MSNLYPDLVHTNYPEMIDHYEDMIDVNAAIKPLIDQYYSLYNMGDFDGMNALLTANPTLRKALHNAQKWNYLKDTVEAQGRFYKDDVRDYLMNIIKLKGDFAETTKYNKYDVVGYLMAGAKQYFMGISTNIPIGTLPTNSAYFVPLTLRGEPGASGTGLSFRKNWSNITQYYTSDLVVHNNTLWVANNNNLNSVPQDVSTDWSKLFMVVDSIEFTEEIPTEPLPREADLLGGHDASYFATAELVSTLSGDITGLKTNDIGLPTDTATLYELSGSATADEALKKAKQSLFMLNKKVYVSDTVTKTFVVPPGVTKIYAFGCAAGGAILAGQYALGTPITVTPGETLGITVGTGNTIIKRGATAILTLVAASISESLNINLFGFTMGVKGDNGVANGTSSGSPLGNNAASGGGAAGFGAGGGAGGSTDVSGGNGGAFGFGGGGGGKWASGSGGAGAKTIVGNTARIPVYFCEFLSSLIDGLDFGTAGNGGTPTTSNGLTATNGYGKYAGLANNTVISNGGGSQGLLILCY
ncbi:hypothetical protein [Sinanaerobacter chloroacetimidivorans]|uniref:Uncharacterized protein n=1 Tax=Sinanaerobacter chloroacetimidivorans TaxID=2818044 RepID=A0A8J7W0G0_9FIRM|nr:hypothetical protein [Sinanaerobacter chloroacetimidivorans]MBR0596970.1 hypothetical protein [Sinanaerobacter chloroacetimidivorans]